MESNIIDSLYWSNLASALKTEQQTLSSEQLVAEIQLRYEMLREKMDKDTLDILNLMISCKECSAMSKKGKDLSMDSK